MITSKQRATLRGMANKIEPVVQVGKEGLSENILENVREALEARELIKVTVLETCPLTAREAIAEVLENIRGAEPVQVIGRKFIVYKRNQKDPKIVI